LSRSPESGRGEHSGGAQYGQDEDAGQARGFAGTPIGVFVVGGDDAYWVPAVDTNRIAFIGVLTGLPAAVIGTRITITDYR
jgi:hypothetical protein